MSSSFSVEILGSGGAVTIPRPGCTCRVCVEARAKGAPYARTGPSVFVHGPDVLIDTPEESKIQLNRSQVTRIAAGLYSHWHPDHTAGRRVWESRNFDFRSWPRRFETTPLYIPERVWADFEANYGLADQFRFMEKQGTVKVVQVVANEPFDVGDTRVTAVPLDAENAHAFLFERDGKRVLVAMDETHGWTPPELGSLDLAVLPVGVFELHPFTGERMIPEEFCKPPVSKTRYAQALELVRALAPRQAVLSHVEEMDRLSHDELVRLGAADGWSRHSTGSSSRFDGEACGAIRLRPPVGTTRRSESAHLGGRRDRDHRPRRRRGRRARGGGAGREGGRDRARDRRDTRVELAARALARRRRRRRRGRGRDPAERGRRRRGRDGDGGARRGGARGGARDSTTRRSS